MMATRYVKSSLAHTIHSFTASQYMPEDLTCVQYSTNLLSPKSSLGQKTMKDCDKVQIMSSKHMMITAIL